MCFFFIHILGDVSTNIGEGSVLEPMIVCAVSRALYTIRQLRLGFDFLPIVIILEQYKQITFYLVMQHYIAHKLPESSLQSKVGLNGYY